MSVRLILFTFGILLVRRQSDSYLLEIGSINSTVAVIQ